MNKKAVLITIINNKGTYGPELIINGNMASGDPPDNWVIGGDNPVLSRVSDNGAFAANVVLTANSGGVIQLGPDLVIGKTYHLSMDLKNIDLTGAGVRGIVFDHAFTIIISTDFVTATDWTTVTVDFTPVTESAYIYFQGAGSADESYRATNISLREVLNP